MERDDSIEIEPTLLDAVRRAAAAEGASPTEFVNRILTDRLAFSDPQAYFAARAARARASGRTLSDLLRRDGGEPPIPGDELDEPFEPRPGRDAAE